MTLTDQEDLCEKIAFSLAQRLAYWKGFLRNDEQRAAFFIWLKEHTKHTLHEERFVDDMKNWLMQNHGSIDELIDAALTIQTEILWTKYMYSTNGGKHDHS
jgi:hypothetical protein